MSRDSHRRDFLRTAAGAGAALGLANSAFLQQLPVVSAAESKQATGNVTMRDEIEPIVHAHGPAKTVVDV